VKGSDRTLCIAVVGGKDGCRGVHISLAGVCARGGSRARTMNTMFRIEVHFCACSSCSTISPDVRSPFRPMVPAAMQKGSTRQDGPSMTPIQRQQIDSMGKWG
jgi:hypothetical protein